MSNEGKKDGQSGGVNISGIVGSVGGNIVGGDETTVALSPVLDAIKAASPQVRQEAETKLVAVKQEAAKGKDGMVKWPNCWTS
jgi:hypothetical protein